MCLVMSASPQNADLECVAQLLADELSVSPLGVCVPRRSFERRSTAFTIFEHGRGSCACSFLHDDASWEHPSWLLRPEIRGPLAATLRRLRDHLPGGFDFQAFWVGERPSDSVSLSIDALCDLITGAGIGTKTLYHVQ